MCVCICACMRAYPHKCHGTCMEVRGQLVGSWFSLPTMWVLGDQTQIVMLGSKHLYLMSHLASSNVLIFNR